MTRCWREMDSNSRSARHGEIRWHAVSLDIRRSMRHGGRRRGRPRFLLLGEPFHGAGGPYGWDGLRFAAPLGRLHALARELVEAPAVHPGIEHFQGSAASVARVVMFDIG